MWFIFPQADGLGHSSLSRLYSINSSPEARAYLVHPILGKRIHECCEILLPLKTDKTTDIFYFPDDFKLMSSITLFKVFTLPGSVFQLMLHKYFEGKPDPITILILKECFNIY